MDDQSCLDLSSLNLSLTIAENHGGGTGAALFDTNINYNPVESKMQFVLQASTDVLAQASCPSW